MAAWPIPTAVAKRREFFLRMLEALAELFGGSEFERPEEPLVFLVSRNRPATTCLHRSVPAVKADAARSLFQINCSEITWAIVDSGVDARHPAFGRRNADGSLKKLDPKSDWSAASRVTATYDFTLIRRVLSTDDDDVASLPPKLKSVFKRSPERRKEIRERLITGREIDWQLLLPFLQVAHDKDYPVPGHDHGTHVAGIMGADWRPSEDPAGQFEAPLQGVCPTINLIDVRILDEKGEGDEFSVMAGLQFLRYLNSHKDYMVVHGANLSLSIIHDVANYACGRTPVCEECERLIASGVIVVAAAGNDGFEREFVGSKGGDYRSISITDPGNAASVITVGSTHRDMPHTYGVSYFSSRGPTGDGRIKPDLVAPGEKIDSTSPGTGLVRKDGTSMAAPHVSGAAALLIARHREFIGQPGRVKTVLCETATDLGRERYFQGCGMLDVLRALQNV
jgi:subtilisin family serine protease